MAEREITFRLRARDESGAAFESLKNKATGAGGAMEGVVSKDLGQRLNHFNSTGQKAASILSQMGGSAGVAAGQVTRFGGTISSMIGRTTLLEGALIAVGTAVVALGAKFYDMAFGAIDEADKKLEETIKKTDDLIARIKETTEAERLSSLGLSENEKRILDLKRQRSTVDSEIASVADKIRMTYSDEIGFLSKERGERKIAEDETILAGKTRIELLDGEIERLQEIVQLEKDRTAAESIGPTRETYDKERNRPGGRGGKAGTPDPSGGAGAGYYSREQMRIDEAAAEEEESDREAAEYYQQKLDDAITRTEREQAIEEGHLGVLSIMKREFYDEQMAMDKEYAGWKKESDKELREQEEKSYDSMNDTIGKVGQMGSSLVKTYETIAVATAKSEKEAAKHRAIAAALLAALKVGEEIAYAASSFAHQDYFEGALHIVAAAMWAAQAATANQQGGGGGASAAAAPAPGPTDRQYWADRKESGQTGNITINVDGNVISGHSAGEMIEDFLKMARQKRNPTAPRTEMEV